MPAYAVEGLTLSGRAPGGGSRPGPDGVPGPALDQVSFQAAPGELLVVLGGAGAGKTALLRTLAGLETPTAGRVLEDGRDITSLPPQRREAAMVFQEFSLYPHLSVEGNLAFPLQSKAAALPAPEAASRVRETAAFLGLADKLARMPGDLSAGEKRWVALGRALVRRPRLLLLDDPLAGLDAKLRERMAADIRRVQRAAQAVFVYATRDSSEAMALADRILALDAGRAVQVGAPDELYRQPADSRVARMLGRPAINLFAHEEAARMGLVDAASARHGAAAGPVGVRPEAWRVTADPAGPALIKGVEQRGPALVLHLDAQGITLRAATHPAARFKAGDRVRLGVEPGDILHFPN